MKPPGRRFTPRVTMNIRAAFTSFTLSGDITVESLYEAIIATFLSHSPEKPTVEVNEAESWLSLIPGNLRYFRFYEEIVSKRFYL
jgi:hypothetical protein